MRGITRRGALGGAMATLLAGYVATPATLHASQLVQIPRRPMRLLRRLERGMRGGAILAVQREWQIAFSVQGGGYAIEGTQLSAKVDAPRNLAPLAEIEKSRSTADMFPILLGSNGSITAAGRFTRKSDLAAAISIAETMIARRPISDSAKSQQMLYLSQLQSAGSSLFKQLPSDLFFPTSIPFRDVRLVSLPDGMTGEFEVVYEAKSSADHGWLKQAERRIVTRIDQSVRQSREFWSMSPI